MRPIFRVRTLLTATMLLALPTLSLATEYLFYFDVSDSARSDQQMYLQEFERFVEQRAVPGDKIALLFLNGDTRNFQPFAHEEMKPPAGGASEKKKRQVLAGQRADLVVTAATYLKRAAKANSTNIIGAMISAADHFRQEHVTPDQRCVVIFTDGLEASTLSGINMERQIPKKVPAGVTLPADLSAELHMIGINPPAKAGAQEALRSFWEDVAGRTGSRLVRYIRGT